MDEWTWNGLRKCWERGPEGEEQRIYPSDGEFTVSDGGAWLPGTFKTLEEAKAALED